MDELVVERSGFILRLKLNRPRKRNAMTSSMYMALADALNDAAKDERTRVVLLHGEGEGFCAGNDLEDFLNNPPGAGESPQSRLMNALLDFGKPPVAAVHGAAVGSGTTMLLHCDFVYAGETARFQMPFINLAVVPEFGSSCVVTARIGHARAADLILLGSPFNAKRAEDIGFVTQVVPDKILLEVAGEAARKLAEKPAGVLQASKRLMRLPVREQIRAAMKAENEEFSVQVRSDDAREAIRAIIEKRPPRFAGNTKITADA
jgi:enoyl-CoA hydratase/carnithine racemase